MATSKNAAKIVYYGETLVDLTDATVVFDENHESSDLMSGKTAYGRDGKKITGTCEYDAKTSDANANETEILLGRTAYVKGSKVTGTMPNNGGVTGTISTKNGEYTIPRGYHDGSGKVSIDATEQAKIIPENIRQGVHVLGIEGTMSGLEDVNAQAKVAMPKTEDQTIVPDKDYNYLTQVTITKIPYVTTYNEDDGLEITIG